MAYYNLQAVTAKSAEQIMWNNTEKVMRELDRMCGEIGQESKNIMLKCRPILHLHKEGDGPEGQCQKKKLAYKEKEGTLLFHPAVIKHLAAPLGGATRTLREVRQALEVETPKGEEGAVAVPREMGDDETPALKNLSREELLALDEKFVAAHRVSYELFDKVLLLKEALKAREGDADEVQPMLAEAVLKEESEARSGGDSSTSSSSGGDDNYYTSPLEKRERMLKELQEKLVGDRVTAVLERFENMPDAKFPDLSGLVE